MKVIKYISLGIALSTSTPVMANSTEPLDDVLTELIQVIENPNHFKKRRQIIGNVALNIQSSAQALGPVFATAQRLNSLGGGCYIVGLNMEVQRAMATDGKRYTMYITSPVPVCPDGKPPKTQMTPEQMAATSAALQELQRTMNQSTLPRK